ncbi:MAG: hypothetical protein U0263_01505 [Polyangiaceae bacterium]
MDFSFCAAKGAFDYDAVDGQLFAADRVFQITMSCAIAITTTATVCRVLDTKSSMNLL